MTRPGTDAQPLRVAIVGAGPTGFYATDQLFRQPGLVAEVDMYDRVPTPYGLVRVGVGNVAADVARILSRTPEELAATDIADYALEALSASRIREVYVLGRRGPAQAAFTNPEVRELGELAGADITALPDEVELDELTRQALERAPDRATQKKVEILTEYAQRAPTGNPRRLVTRFPVSPVELRDDGTGAVGGMRLVRNRLYATATGTLQPKATGEFEELPVGLVFRSVGYRGVPLPGVPFNADWGVLP